MMAAINPPKIRTGPRITDPIFAQESQDTSQILQQLTRMMSTGGGTVDSGASLYKLPRPAARPSQPLKLQPVRVESQAALDNLSCTQRQPVIQSYFKLNIVNLL